MTGPVRLTIETGREADGRWIAEVVDLPGVLVYDASEHEAVRRARALARAVIADRMEHGESCGGHTDGRN